jgi:hypothetical protein
MLRFLFSTVKRNDIRISNLPKTLDEIQVGKFLNTFTKVSIVKILRDES